MSKVNMMSKVDMSEIQASEVDLTPRSNLHWLAAAVILFLTILATSWGNRLYLGQEVLVDYWPLVTESCIAPTSTSGAIEQ